MSVQVRDCLERRNTRGLKSRNCLSPMRTLAVVSDGEIGRGARESTAKAVMRIAIEEANRRRSWLLDTTLFVTIEPSCVAVPLDWPGSLRVRSDQSKEQGVSMIFGRWAPQSPGGSRNRSWKQCNHHADLLPPERKSKPSSQPRPKHKGKNRTFAKSNKLWYNTYRSNSSAWSGSGESSSP